MKIRKRALVAMLLCHSCAFAAAQDPERVAPAQREIIPGSELMTSRERDRYRERMRAAGTPQARARVREQHVKQLRERARLRGLDLVDPNQREKQ